jgi:hypothetical protein
VRDHPRDQRIANVRPDELGAPESGQVVLPRRGGVDTDHPIERRIGRQLPSQTTAQIPTDPGDQDDAGHGDPRLQR